MSLVHGRTDSPQEARAQVVVFHRHRHRRRRVLHLTVAARTVQNSVVVPAAQMTRTVVKLFQAARGHLGLSEELVVAGPCRMLLNVVLGRATPMNLQRICRKHHLCSFR